MPFPGPTTYLPIEGGQVAVGDAGAGPPIVLLHGSRDDRHYWARNLLPLLQGDFRCIAWDQRNYGASTKGLPETYPHHAEDLAAVVRWFGLDRLLLVGASWGAKIALAYAASYPCRGVFCLDDVVLYNIGSLHEDIYERIHCPIFAVFGTRSAEDLGTGLIRRRGSTGWSSATRASPPAGSTAVTTSPTPSRRRSPDSSASSTPAFPAEASRLEGGEGGGVVREVDGPRSVGLPDDAPSPAHP